MKTSHCLRTLGLGSIVLLSACSTSSFDQIQGAERKVPSYEGMYLRGVFNWWEANEQFKLNKTSKNVYKTTLELIADGQPYDFKVADSNWTASLNCGAFELRLLELEEVVSLACQENSLNLQFQPEQTGQFDFILEVSNPVYPELRITKAK